jgi:3-phosphoshikimate 1-carboxyvinyltransferase
VIVTVPGDKSVTQRALILAALSEGTSRLSGLLGGADPLSTARALRALGATIPPIPPDGSPVEVVGRGLRLRGLVAPGEVLDLGNSGTGARLLLGVLAGQPEPFEATVTGDDSLVRRPMARVTGPLGLMGARFQELGDPGRLPVRVRGGPLHPVDLDLPVASAQVKSALLLAGLVGGSSVLLTEPGRSRDHTERMLRALGAPVLTHAAGPGWRVELRDPPDRLDAREWPVPGDVSSAAFLLAAAALTGGRLSLPRVGLNPTRTRFLEVMRRMGVRVHERIDGDELGEPIGELLVEPGDRPIGTVVTPDELPLVIDEVPVLAALAVHAVGPTRFAGAGELRVKESDRLAGLARMLRGLGVRAGVEGDDLVIAGGGAEGGHLVLGDDHRMAMAATVAALGARGPSELVGLGSAAVSFPGFVGVLKWLGARIEGEG